MRSDPKRIAMVAGALLLPTVLPAQAAPARLRPADATLAEEFTAITSARELSDGRVLITDPRDGRVVVADFATGKVAPVGRKGPGPREYAMAFPLLATTGDPSIMANGLNRRWLLFAGDSPVVTLPPDAPVVARAAIVLGADRSGHVLTIESSRPSRGGESPDSTSLLLVDRRTGHIVLVCRLAPVDVRYIPTKRGDYSPFGSAFEWARLARDGWIAVLRLNPYRVDWRSPDGRWVHGAPVGDPPIPFDARQRDWWEGRARANGMTLGATPPVLPPFFGAENPLMTQDGMAVIHRLAPAPVSGTPYDVVDHRGVRVRRLMLAANERIVDFGPRSVYVVTSDSNDIQRLSRHPWP